MHQLLGHGGLVSKRCISLTGSLVWRQKDQFQVYPTFGKLSEKAQHSASIPAGILGRFRELD
jgi:hypothetical protein